MGRKKKKKGSDANADRRTSDPDGVRAEASTSGAARSVSSARLWYRSNRTDLRFLLVFGSVMLLYYVLTTTAISKESFFPWYLQKTTQVSGGVINVFGYDGLTVSANVLNSPRGSITIERGCDAMAPTALFVAAVLASPTPVILKLPAVFGGVFILMVINIVRIITLFLTRMHWPKAFDIMHVDVWQVLFILLAIVLWAAWASWTTKRIQRLAHVPT